MEEISPILEHWSKEESKYQRLAEYIKTDLEKALKDQGIFTRISYRVKDTISLTKKIYKNNMSFEDYTLMSDKAGVRVICRFRDDVSSVNNIIKERYSFLKEEDKSSLLKLDQQGYKSHHFDIQIKTRKKELDDIRHLICEIQVRTFCEDVWAELYHDIGYKGYSELPDEPKRQMFCLGGLLEVADDVFTGINNKIKESEKLNVNVLQRIIEPTGVMFFDEKPDREFTSMFLEQILPLVHLTPSEFDLKFKAFVQENKDKIMDIIESSVDRLVPFATQPELILIFMLIEEDPFSLKETWEKIFPLKDLEKIAIWWGMPIEDITTYG